MRCACVRDDADDCAVARYGLQAGEPCECPCHDLDKEWNDRVADEAVSQILATPDEDVLAGKWSPLVGCKPERK